MQDYKIPGTNVELKVNDLISIAGSGIQARVTMQHVASLLTE